MQPRFSIIVTTTRPRLLPFSMRTALAQTFRDYEIVVSDNSKDGCRDLVTSIAGDRVRYVRPEKPLGVVDHWEFAYSHAQGDWHLQLCDDDALAPNTLAILDRNIREDDELDAICWSYGSYRGAEHWDTPGRLRISEFSGRATDYEPDDLLAKMFDDGTGLFHSKPIVPFFPRSACRKTVLDQVRQRQGILFQKLCPMTSGAAAVLAVARKSRHIDVPLTILGSTVDSVAGWTKDQTALTALVADSQITMAPIKFSLIWPTAQTEALLRVQQANLDKLGAYKVNYVNYFLHCARFIREGDAAGVDMSAFWRAFDEVLTTMPAETQRQVRAGMNDAPAMRPSLYAQLRQRVADLIKPLRGPRIPGEVNADRLGLHDIADCAIYVGSVIDRRLGAA